MSGYSGQLLSKQDHYAKKGIEQAAKSLPPTSAANLDSLETQLLADAQRLALSDHADYARKQATKAKALGDINDALSQAGVACETLLDDQPLAETISHAQAQQRPVLVKLREDQLIREAELKAFRDLNGITEKASYPDNLLIPYLILLPIVLAETIANAFFYENAQGLLGGAFVALVVSIVNLAFAFLLGNGWRYKNLASTGHKIAGWACGVGAVLVAIYFNAIFSAYRSEYQLLVDPTDVVASGAAFKRAMGIAGYVFVGRLPSSDLMSFILFFVGLVLSVIAFRKGYTCDDRYPGHGKRDRLFVEATRRYETELEVVRLKLLGDVQRRVTGMASAKTQLLQMKARLDQVKNSLPVDVSSLQASLVQLQRDFALVLNTYRQKNVSVRPIPAPAYFAETPDVIGQYQHEDGSELMARIEAAGLELETLKSSYLSRLNDSMRDLENQGRELQGPGFAAFQAEVTKEAQKNIDARILTMPTSPRVA
jgi:hypothetical protein